MRNSKVAIVFWALYVIFLFIKILPSCSTAVLLTSLNMVEEIVIRPFSFVKQNVSY
jgi:hypothetical protein